MNVSLLRERENSLRGANGRLALAALVITSGVAHAELEYSTSFDTPDLPGLGISICISIRTCIITFIGIV